MRILHVMQWFIPGLGYQENFLPFKQAALGHQVSIIAANQLPPYFQTPIRETIDLSPGIKRIGDVTLIRLPARFVGKWAQVYLFDLEPQIRQIQPDVIHAHGLWAVPTFQVLRCQRKMEMQFGVVVDDHMDNGNYPTGIGGKVRLGIAKVTARQVITKGGYILSVNPFSYWVMTHQLRLPIDRVRMLFLGLDTDTFFPDAAGRETGRRQLGLEAHNFVFVTSGRLVSGKGFEMLVRAFADLYPDFPHARLLFIGSGPADYQNALRALVDQCRVKEAVIFVDWVSSQQLNVYYNAADVGVMPGKLGGIKEILAVGKPLIVPDHLATQYFVANGGGISFQAEHQDSLRDAMVRYLRDTQQYQRDAAQALEAAQRLSWSTIARESVEIYHEVIPDR